MRVFDYITTLSERMGTTSIELGLFAIVALLVVLVIVK